MQNGLFCTEGDMAIACAYICRRDSFCVALRLALFWYPDTPVSLYVDERTGLEFRLERIEVGAFWPPIAEVRVLRGGLLFSVCC